MIRSILSTKSHYRLKWESKEARVGKMRMKGREGKQGKDSETRVYCNVNECQGPAAKGNLQRTWGEEQSRD